MVVEELVREDDRDESHSRQARVTAGAKIGTNKQEPYERKREGATIVKWALGTLPVPSTLVLSHTRLPVLPIANR